MCSYLANKTDMYECYMTRIIILVNTQYPFLWHVYKYNTLVCTEKRTHIYMVVSTVRQVFTSTFSGMSFFVTCVTLFKAPLGIWTFFFYINITIYWSLMSLIINSIPFVFYLPPKIKYLQKHKVKKSHALRKLRWTVDSAIYVSCIL